MAHTLRTLGGTRGRRLVPTNALAPIVGEKLRLLVTNPVNFLEGTCGPQGKALKAAPVMVAAHGKVRQADVATYRAYRILTHGIFVMLVVFFLAGERITWINCLTGFGWRAWLLLYALPSWFTAVKTPAAK